MYVNFSPGLMTLRLVKSLVPVSATVGVVRELLVADFNLAFDFEPRLPTESVDPLVRFNEDCFLFKLNLESWNFCELVF